MRRLATCASLALALTAAACGGSDPGGGASPPDSAHDVTTAMAASDDLPGERVDTYPYEGSSLAVVGVERGQTLAIRSGPDADRDVVHELAPLDTEIIATGHNRRVGDTVWAEVDKDDHHGWAEVAYLLHLGGSDDITSELTDPSGELPAGETMVDVAQAVAARRASDEPPSRIAIIEDPEVGDLGSITVDVIGLGDDALGGERLHILATPIPEAFVVQSVRRLSLCRRGVTGAKLCV